MGTSNGAERTTYSILGSSLLHSGVVIAVLMMNIDTHRTPEKELIQIELKLGSEVTTPVPLITEAPKPAQIPEVAEKLELPAKTEAPAALPSKQLPVKQVATQAAPPTQTMTPAPSAPATPPMAVKTPPVLEKAVSMPGVPQSKPNVAVIKFQKTKQEAVSKPVAVKNATPDESELKEGLDQVAKETDSSKLADPESFPEVDSVIDESEVLAQKAREQEKMRAAEMAEAAEIQHQQEKENQEKIRNERAATLAADQALAQSEAQQQAQENLTAEKEARAQAKAEADARVKVAKAAAIQAAQETAAAKANEDAQSERQEIAAQNAKAAARAAGPAPKGALQGSNEEAGPTSDEGAVRGLEDLKQMPGNRRPQYGSDDRLNNRMGDVVFHAFITKEGTPSNFKMVQSTGFRELDYKTLKAIKEWKFYPGQEGWVEIPFRWDLKGEPTPIGGTLRKFSQK